MAALETKLEGHEKEIKQLQKALEKSDRYIAELESKQKENCLISKTTNNRSPPSGVYKENNTSLISSSTSNIGYSNENQTSPTHKTSSHRTTTTSQMKYIKGDNQTFKNDLKIVKFSEKIDHIPTSNNSTFTSPPSNIANGVNSASSSLTKQVVISNDKFYGSPSKTVLSSSSTAIINTPNSYTVMSFSERLKKNAFNSTTNVSSELEAPSPLSQSLIAGSNQSTQNLFTNSSETQSYYNTKSSTIAPNNASNQNNHSFLFSPMKRLRLDEFSLEKPSFNGEDTMNNTHLNETSNMDSNFSKPTTPPNNNNNYRNGSPSFDPESKKSLFKTAHSVTPYNFNYKSRLKNGKEELIDDDYDEVSEEITEKKPESFANMDNSTSEFIDCMELLNKAEKKVQNRHTSPSVTPIHNAGKNTSPNSSNYNNSTLNRAMLASNSEISAKNNSYSVNDFNRTQYSSNGLPEKYFRPTNQSENSLLTNENLMNHTKNENGGSKLASNIMSPSSSSSSPGNSLSATIPTGASSLVSSNSVASSSSFHSTSNGFINNENYNRNYGNSKSSLYHDHDYSLNSTLTNKDSTSLNKFSKGELFFDLN